MQDNEKLIVEINSLLDKLSATIEGYQINAIMTAISVLAAGLGADFFGAGEVAAGLGVGDERIGVALAEADKRAVVLEKKPHLGGRAFSFKDHETGVTGDNGQHLFMGCYRQTLDFLAKIGTADRLTLLPEIRVDFADADGGRDAFYLGEFGTGLRAMGPDWYTEDDLATPGSDWVEPLAGEAAEQIGQFEHRLGLERLAAQRPKPDRV